MTEAKLTEAARAQLRYPLNTRATLAAGAEALRIIDEQAAQLAEARAEAERLTDRLTEQVANGDGWRTGQAAAENRCHSLSTSLSETRALLVRCADDGGMTWSLEKELNEYLLANPEEEP